MVWTVRDRCGGRVLGEGATEAEAMAIAERANKVIDWNDIEIEHEREEAAPPRANDAIRLDNRGRYLSRRAMRR